MENQKIAFLGIDPGSSGAAVAFLSDTTEPKILRFQNSTHRQVWQFLEELSFDYKVFCVLELVGAMPGQGVTSMFTFGKEYGMITGFLVAGSIPYEEKVPRTWQKALGITPRYKPKKGEQGVEETKTEFKRRLRQKAEQLYPEIKMTNDVADAILIAHFCKTINK